MARQVAHDGRRIWRYHDKARGGIVFVIEDIVGGQQQSYRLNNLVVLARELGVLTTYEEVGGAIE